MKVEPKVYDEIGFFNRKMTATFDFLENKNESQRNKYNFSTVDNFKLKLNVLKNQKSYHYDIK